MYVVNEDVIRKGTHKVVIVHNFVEKNNRAFMTKFGLEMRKFGINLNEVCHISLFDKPTKKFGVGELREAVKELEEFLKIVGCNVLVDNSYTFDMKTKKTTKGLIFKSIFNRDNTLWKDRGVLEASFNGVKVKSICTLRWESIAREKDSKELIDSEFIVNPDLVEIIIPKTVEEAKSCFKELFQCDYFAFDTEASGLRPFAKDFLLYTLQFTSNKEKNKSYIFFYEHPKVPISNELKDVVSKGTKWLLENRKVWVHNFSYDGLVCKRKFDIDFYKVNIYDSMIIYHMLTNTYEAVPLGLKEIAFTEGVFYDWDNDLDKFKDEYLKEHKMKKDDFKYEYFDVKDLTLYGAYDTVCLIHLVDVLENKSKNHPALDVIRETWEKHWKSIMQSLYYVMYNGLPFDMEGAKKLKKKNEDRIKEIDELISSNSFVKGAEKKMQEIALEKAWAEYNKKVEVARGKGKEFKGKEPNIENGKYGSIDLCPKFKTTSTAHKKILFIDVLKMKVLETTDTGNPKLSDDIISKYAEERPDIDILGLFSEKAKLGKSLTTYIDPWIKLVEEDIDGRLRSTFNPLNTSGRLRGSKPNLLNITKGAGLKELIKSDTKNGWVFSQIDVNSLENISAILLHKDPYQLELLDKIGELDPHSGFSILRSKISEDGILDKYDAMNVEHLKEVKAKFKDHRQKSKNGVFSIQFLGSHKSIQYAYDLSEEKAKKLWEGHWELNKGEWEFIKNKVKIYANRGWDIVHGNFPILTPNITEDMNDKDNMNKIRPSYNATHQSSAYAVLRALDKANRRFMKENIPCKLVLSVYDSIIYEGHIDHIAYVSNVLYEYMSEPFIENQLFPLSHEVEIGIDYSAEFVLSRDKEEQKKQLEEFREKHKIGMKGE